MAEPLALSVLQTIKLGRSLPIEFLASKFGTSRSQIDDVLDPLENEGIVRRVADDRVEFVDLESASSTPHAPTGAGSGA